MSLFLRLAAIVPFLLLVGCATPAAWHYDCAVEVYGAEYCAAQNIEDE